ncbi:hypothetical protein SNEBB_008065 [Seison nebaliae]|nr:hypothetical protein SNEBB_008065 [Seison nebaliae]
MVSLKHLWKRHTLLIVTTIFVLCSLFTSVLLRYHLHKFSPGTIDLIIIWCGFPGEIFIRSLKLMILPMIITCIIAALAELHPTKNSKVTMIMIGYILIQNFIGSLLGILFGQILNINNSRSSIINKNSSFNSTEGCLSDIFQDIFRNFIPDNIVIAFLHSQETKLTIINENNSTIYKRKIQNVGSMNVLGVVVFSVIFGMSTSMCGSAAESFKKLIMSLNEIVLQILRWIIYISPIGIASLLLRTILEIKNFSETLQMMGVFVAVFVALILVEIFVIYPIEISIITKDNPFSHFRHFSQGALLAFTTASSACACPEVMDKLHLKCSVPKSIVRFVIPTNVTLSKPGSSAFLSLSVILMADVQNHTITFPNYVVILFMTFFLSLALPSIPSSAIVAIITISNAIELDAEYVSLLFLTEWILDRLRTLSNTVSHIGCAIIAGTLHEPEMIELNKLLIDEKQSPSIDGSSKQFSINYSNALQNSDSRGFEYDDDSTESANGP